MEREVVYFEDVEVGSVRQSGEFELSEDEIIEFAKRWDPQPFHIDAEVAIRSPLGGLTAAGCHLFCVAARLTHDFKPLAIIGGLKQEVEYLNPARPGDRLSLIGTCAAKRLSTSKPDRGIMTFVSEVKNRQGQTVLRMTSDLLVRVRGEG